MLVGYVLKFIAWFSVRVTHVYGSVFGVPVMLWTYVQKMPGLSYGQDMGYAGVEAYCGFPYSLQVNLGIVPWAWETQISQIRFFFSILLWNKYETKWECSS